ncbi:MAG: DUF1080 domain-containing protein [Gemmatimonadaceae bacterium]|nr:DUF1080 domain-containing protein [Gemmatimonadaceae bacterium]
MSSRAPANAAVVVGLLVALHSVGMARQRASAAQPGPWRSLVEGGSLAAWRSYQADTMPNGWKAEGGMLSKTRPTGDIITRDQFGDFEFSVEWKISEGGNAGIFYRATEEYPRIYWSAPEYQLLDDARAPDGKNQLTSVAAAYGIYGRTGGAARPPAEWNETRIIARGAHIEHWLNGVKVVEYELWSPDWKAKVAASKFKDWPNYGLARRGHIGLQGDHNGALEFRNVRIREWK